MTTKEITPEMRSAVLAEYEKGTGTCEIAAQLNVKRWVPWRILSQAGVELRRKSVYKKKYNQQFFDEYSPESAYWAGFILADGNVTRNSSLLQMALSNVDESHLLKFCQAIGLDNELTPDDDCVRMSVSGKHVCKSLADNFGVYPCKSNVSVFPEQIPEHLWSHFIRGIFDGDGSVTSSQSGNLDYPSGNRRYIVANFTGSIQLLSFLKMYFHDKVGVIIGNGSITAIPPTHIVGRYKKTGQIAYSGKNALKILKWMYDDSYDNIRLSRKFEKFKKMEKND